MQHIEQGTNMAEVCDHCGAGLDMSAVIQDMVHLQNVSLKLAQRITCDEEERQRFGYKLVTAYRFPDIGGSWIARTLRSLLKGTGSCN